MLHADVQQTGSLSTAGFLSLQWALVPLCQSSSHVIKIMSSCPTLHPGALNLEYLSTSAELSSYYKSNQMPTEN